MDDIFKENTTKKFEAELKAIDYLISVYQ